MGVYQGWSAVTFDTSFLNENVFIRVVSSIQGGVTDSIIMAGSQPINPPGWQGHNHWKLHTIDLILTNTKGAGLLIYSLVVL